MLKIFKSGQNAWNYSKRAMNYPLVLKLSETKLTGRYDDKTSPRGKFITHLKGLKTLFVFKTSTKGGSAKIYYETKDENIIKNAIRKAMNP